MVADTVKVDTFGDYEYGDLDSTLRAAVESDPEGEEEPKKERKKRVKKK